MSVSYEAFGSGPEGVIVFNDWLADCSSYLPMRPYLDTDRFTYAFVDLRGYGRSRDVAGKHTAREAADDAFDVADRLGWNQMHIVGFSMTGMVVERMVVDRPERIKSEIAIGPVSAAAVPMDPAEKAFFISTITDDDAVRALVGRISAGRLSKKWLDYKLMLARTTRDHSAVPDYLEMWTAGDFSEEVKRAVPRVPLLVVVGEWDQESFLEPRMQETFMAWHPNAELVVLRNCGHCPMQETPVYLATLIEKFMLGNAEV